MTLRILRVLKLGAYAALMGTLLAGGAWSQDKPRKSQFQPTLLPQLDVKRAAGPIAVDGDLSDAGWQGAAEATGFTEHSPGEEVEPPVRTKAMVTYDDENLYLTAICYADPATVRASMCEREEIFDDDNIGFFFDTYGDASRAYIINLNPYGIPYDALWTPNNGEDGNFDLIFESSGKVTDSGYQVEMAIPFRSLRFPNKPVQEWRFDFYRHHDREVPYSMSWAAYDKDASCWPCQWGTVHGIRDVVPGRGVELLGSYVAQQSGHVTDESDPTGSFENAKARSEPSIGGKYALTSDIVLEGTYNPDFSQIESDASQVDVNSTFALSYPERRPFFQEGMDLFLTNFFAVYTRTINDPDFAVKGSAKLGRVSVAALSAHDENGPVILPFSERSEFAAVGKSYINMLAVHRSFGSDSHIRFMATDRRYQVGGSGTLASMDGTLRLNKSLQIQAQGIVTHTEEPNDSTLSSGFDSSVTTFDHGKHTSAFDGEKFSGTALLSNVVYNSRRTSLVLTAYQRTPTYRADMGFQPRNNDRWLKSQGSYEFLPKGSIFRSIQPGFEVARIYDFDGIRKDEWLAPTLWTAYRFAQAQLWLQWMVVSNERFGGTDFRKLWTFTVNPNAQPTKWLGLGGYFQYGRQIARSALRPGMQTHLEGWATIRPMTRLQTEYTFVYQRNRDADTHEEYFEGYIFRTRWSYQFTRRFSARLVGEYDEFKKRWSLDPLLTYRINPFSTFYAGATYDYLRFDNTGTSGNLTTTALDQRQFFLKLQYLFQT